METVLIAIGTLVPLLVILVVIHEFGHFATAKFFNVKVHEFGVGFPPKLFGIRKGETEYTLNLIPLGGFVKMAGEEDPEVPGSLASKSIGTRILVLSSGALVNALLPLLLFSLAFIIPHNLVVGQVAVKEIAPDSPAARAGIEPGDVFLQINERPVRHIGDLQRYIHLNLGQEIALLIQHSDSTTEEIEVIPRWQPPEGQGAIGVQVEMLSPTIVRQQEPFWRAIPLGAAQYIETFVLFKNEIMSWFVRQAAPVVTGPVGIAQITGQVARAGLSPLLEFAAFLSINLAIINIFPLPALDGGRIAFILLEWIRRGRRISPKTEGLVHLIGFFLLMGVIAAVTYNDILRIISGGNLTP